MSTAQMYKRLVLAIQYVQINTILPKMDNFKNVFAPIPPPPDNMWIQMALSFVGVGFALVGGPFFSGCKYLPGTQVPTERACGFILLFNDTSGYIISTHTNQGGTTDG